MASRPIGDEGPAARPGIRTAVRTFAGLPAAALATMVGIVLIVNAHVYGWPGVAAGVLLAAAGIVLGVRCFRADTSAANHPAATGCPESGEMHE